MSVMVFGGNVQFQVGVWVRGIEECACKKPCGSSNAVR